MSRWVQHISGQGEKWEVRSFTSPGDVNPELRWLVEDKGQKAYLYYLPKSEYRLCDPPEEWEDVTRVYTATHLTLTYQCEPTDKITKIDGMHNGPAFIIERKKG